MSSPITEPISEPAATAATATATTTTAAATTEAPAKRVRKVKKPRPEGYPRRPTSAFIAFMNSKRAEFVAEVAASAGGKDSGASNITAVSQLAKVAWANLSEEAKKPWTDEAAEKLRLFNEAAKKWREENPVVQKIEEDVVQETAPAKKKKKLPPPPGTPKKTATAYILYSVAERSNSVAELTVENGSAPSFADVARKTASKWKAMTDDDKKVFQDKAKELADAAKAVAEEELKNIESTTASTASTASTSSEEAPAPSEPAPVKKPASAKKKAAPKKKASEEKASEEKA